MSTERGYGYQSPPEPVRGQRDETLASNIYFGPATANQRVMAICGLGVGRWASGEGRGVDIFLRVALNAGR